MRIILMLAFFIVIYALFPARDALSSERVEVSDSCLSYEGNLRQAYTSLSEREKLIELTMLMETCSGFAIAENLSEVSRSYLIKKSTNKPTNSFKSNFTNNSSNKSKVQTTSIDTSPPELVSIVMSSNEIDVTNGNVIIVVDVELRDESGISDARFWFRKPDLGLFLYSENNPIWTLDEQTNTYKSSLSFTFDATRAPGIYEFSSTLSITDSIGNRTSAYDTAEEIAALGFNPYVDITNGNDVDVLPPELVSIAMSSNEIDVTNGNVIIVIDVELRDESGISDARFWFRKPDLGLFLYSENNPIWTLDEQTNTYKSSLSFTFDATRAPGIYEFSSTLSITDSIGNRTSAYDTAEEIAALGFNPYVDITNGNDVDVLPPELVSIAMSSNEIDVSNGNVTIVVDVELRDESGISDARFLFRKPDSGLFLYSENNPIWTLDEQTNTYKSSLNFTFDATRAPGIYEFSSTFSITDSIGNRTSAYHTAEKLADLGLSPFITVMNGDSAISFDSRISVIQDFSKISTVQISDVQLTVAEGRDYDFRIQAQSDVRIKTIVFTGAGSIASTCRIINNTGSCDLNASVTNGDVFARITSESIVPHKYELVLNLIPTKSSLESNWFSNVVSYPPLDPDGDGLDNEEDPDNDNDGVEDILDVFPFDSSQTQDPVNNPASIYWEIGSSPIQIVQNIVIPEDAILRIDAGVEVYFAKDVSLLIQGRLAVVGEGFAKLSSAGSERWNGVTFKRSAQSNVSQLWVSNAHVGIEITSTDGLTLSNNIVENNDIGIALSTDDGVRSYVNPILNNEVRHNRAGIQATSTGADIQNNVIFDNQDYGINLTGGLCGASSSCGWGSTLSNNLIYNSAVGVRAFGHRLNMVNNDIYDTSIALELDAKRASTTIDNNNLVGWAAFGFVNKAPEPIEINNVWFGEPISEQSICDVRDNISRGAVSFNELSSQAVTQHGYTLPTTQIISGVESHPSCPDDGFSYIENDINWELSDTPIQISESLFIAEGTQITVEANTEILFAPGSELLVAGNLIVNGEGFAKLTSTGSERWNGVTFKRSAQSNVSQLWVSNAHVGIEITSTDGLTLSNNIVENNDIGIALSTDDSVRSYVNPILNNEVRHNRVGIQATSTGADIQNNVIFDNQDYGINLTGGLCGASSSCGWGSTLSNNLIYNSAVGVRAFGHRLNMVNNDIYDTSIALELDAKRASTTIDNNNLVGWAAFGFVNKAPEPIEINNVWFGEPISEQSICDVRDNISRGAVSFNELSSQAVTQHGYTLPTTQIVSGVESHPSCPDDGFSYIENDINWELSDTPIQISESLFIAEGTQITVEANTEILFAPGSELLVAGNLIVNGEGFAKLTSTGSERWNGVTFKRSAQSNVSQLWVSNAHVGIEITSTDGLTLSNNIVENNDIGIALSTDDSVRSYVNPILNNEVRHNRVGIQATSTGADIQNNVIFDNQDYGINLTGGLCGASSSCGWTSTIQSNVISNSSVGVRTFGHNLTLVGNDIAFSDLSLQFGNAKEANLNINQNNLSGFLNFAVELQTAIDIDLGNIWFARQITNEAIGFDFFEDNSLGLLSFSRQPSAFENEFKEADFDGDTLKLIDELSLNSNPFSADTDGDGLTDGEEVSLNTDPTNIDSDLDQLPDGYEVDNALDPLNDEDAILDSDNDGLNNLQEFILQTNLNDPDTDNDGVIDSEDTAPLDSSAGDEEPPQFPTLEDVLVEATGPLTEVSLNVPEVSDNSSLPLSIQSSLDSPMALGEYIIIWTATDNQGNQASANQRVVVQDTTPPEINQIDLIELSLANGLLNIEDRLDRSAIDIVDGQLEVTYSGNLIVGVGEQSLTATSIDLSGNTATKTITVEVSPLAYLVVKEFAEAGSVITVEALLSDEPIRYPVIMELSISSNTVDILQIEISEGLAGTVTYNLSEGLVDGEEVTISTDSGSNAQWADSQSTAIKVVTENKQPTAEISISQFDEETRLVDTAIQDLVFTAIINDINTNDQHQILWQIGQQSFDGASVTLSTEQLAEGLNDVTLIVKESNTSEQFETQVTTNLVVTTLPPLDNTDSDSDGLSDVSEGYGDSDKDGIPNYLDSSAQAFYLPLNTGGRTLQSLPGTKLSAGSLSRLLKNGLVSSVGVSKAEFLANSSDYNAKELGFEIVSEVVNFELSGLPIGSSGKIIYPLAEEISNAETISFRKYHASSGWRAFVVNGDNYIASTQADEFGFCPSVNSPLYQEGIVDDAKCLLIVIKDGGFNDNDGISNGTVSDPGALVRVNQVPELTLMPSISIEENSSETVSFVVRDPENDSLDIELSSVSGEGLIIELLDSKDGITLTSSNVTSDQKYTAEITVSDGHNVISQSIEVTVLFVNQLPVITVPSTNFVGDEGATIDINATATDDDGQALSFQWEQTSGVNVPFTQNTGLLTANLPQVDGDQSVSFKLTVSDSVDSVSQTITIIINDTTTPAPPPATPPSADSGGGGSLNIYLLLLLIGAAGIRRYNILSSFKY